jgi:hypothetical protein
MAWTPHAEGDAISQAAVNANISALETQANSVAAGAITPKSLNEHHLPSVLGGFANKSLSGVDQSYTNTYPGWADDYMSAVAGWQVISSPSGDLEISFTGVDLTKDKLLVMANIGVKDIQHMSGTGVTEGRAAVKIQVQINGGAYEGVSRTERYLDSRLDLNASPDITRVRRGDIPIRTLIDSNDFAGAVTGVRVVVSILYPTIAIQNDATVTLLNSILSGIVLKQAI